MTESQPDSPVFKRKLRISLNMALMCFVGFAAYVGITAYKERLMHSRIEYAMKETRPLRMKIEAYQAAERRWPTAVELGVPAWNPYPDGGGYQLQPNGQIRVVFSVLPELKGHGISLVPKATAEGKLTWECDSDIELRRYWANYCF